MSSIISSARRLLATASLATPSPLLVSSTIITTTSSSSSAPSAPSAPSLRPFSTTPAPQTKTFKPHRLPSDLIPPYPYGERLIYKQSNQGLYGSARIRFGNTIAPKHNNKARRFWRPNVHVKTFLLPSLGARVKTRLTLRVLKTIRREDGLENYLLKDKPARVKELGPGGWNLRWLLMQSRAVRERLEEQRRALGLPPRQGEGEGEGEGLGGEKQSRKEKEKVDGDDVIQYALDYATPGPLSVRSKRTIEELRADMLGAMEQGEFTLGNENLGEVEGVRELSDEEEEALLRGTGAEEAADGKSVEGQKQGSTVSS